MTPDPIFRVLGRAGQRVESIDALV